MDPSSGHMKGQTQEKLSSGKTLGAALKPGDGGGRGEGSEDQHLL